MQIKRLRLQNIRSYIDAEINFPDSSILLSGDIGCGKSTILLGIEFAIFGAKKTDLPAHAMLRHGKKEGSVELKLIIENKEITIKRNLKRGKNGISQESGYIIVDGVKKEGTHIELKTMMLEILGYPTDLVSKSKDLIYRYTVYTPQEEIKRILLEKKEDRLDTLRKVFNIDKYKRIRENAVIYIRSLKEKRREYEGNISDLEEKKKNLKERKKEIKALTAKTEELKPKLLEVKELVRQKKDQIKKTEEKIDELNKLKREVNVEQAHLKNKVEARLRNNSEIENLNKEISILKKDLDEKEKIDPEEIKNNIRSYEQEIDFIEKNSMVSNSRISEINVELKRSKELIDKISSLDKCPTCMQDVKDEYKDNISVKEKEKIKKAEVSIKKLRQDEVEAYEKLKKAQSVLEKLNKGLHNVEITRLKQKNLDEKIRQVENLKKLQDEIKKDIGEINIRKKGLYDELETFKDIDKNYTDEKKGFEELLSRERALEIKNTELIKEKEGIEKLTSELTKDIDKKESIKKRLTYMNEIQNWLEDYFLNLMGNIEKHVMLKVYNEFNDLFRDWFNILLEDEGIQVRIDEEFTPIIEQNGYETYYENLSGGEKTAVALSYRLSLNKVINDIAAEIKTKDIIMLDEPTDGFSTEQLDKMREVLEELNMKQVIIVSHEQKIESFVENVIRVNKEEHVSRVN